MPSLTPVLPEKRNDPDSGHIRSTACISPTQFTQIRINLEVGDPSNAAIYIARAIKANQKNPEVLESYIGLIPKDLSTREAITLVRALDVLRPSALGMDLTPGLALALWNTCTTGEVEREIKSFASTLLPSSEDKLKFIDRVANHKAERVTSDAVNKLLAILDKSYVNHIVAAALSSRDSFAQQAGLEYLEKNPALISNELVAAGLASTTSSRNVYNANRALDLGLELSKKAPELEQNLLGAASGSPSDYVILRRAVAIGSPTIRDINKAEVVLRSAYHTRHDGVFAVTTLAFEVLSLAEPTDCKEAIDRLLGPLDSPELLKELVRSVRKKGASFVDVGLKICDRLTLKNSDAFNSSDLDCSAALIAAKGFLAKHPQETIYQIQSSFPGLEPAVAEMRLELLLNILKEPNEHPASNMLSTVVKLAKDASQLGTSSACQVLKLKMFECISNAEWDRYSQTLSKSEDPKIQKLGEEMAEIRHPTAPKQGIGLKLLTLFNW